MKTYVLAHGGGVISSDVDLSLQIDDIVKVLSFEDLRDVIFVGQSYGGRSPSIFLERRIPHWSNGCSRA